MAAQLEFPGPEFATALLTAFGVCVRACVRALDGVCGSCGVIWGGSRR